MKHLLQVVDDILDYSKLMAGKMKLKMEPFVPIEEVDAVAGIFSTEAKAKGIRLTKDIELPLQEAVIGDALRYRQVLINLVSNAVKFTEKGDVHIRVYRHLMDDGRLMMATEVSDEGVGINEEHLGKLFKPFEQAGLAAKVTYRGTGMGLAISREIVEQQGGSVLLESKPGIGTRVFFSLPYLKAGPSNMESLDEELPDGSFLKGMRILIADDEQLNSRLVESMLEKFGPELTIVEDGNQAYEELNSNPYNVALLDVRMPGKSGLEVAALAGGCNLRQHNAGARFRT